MFQRAAAPVLMLALIAGGTSCEAPPSYDILIRNAVIHDGRGGAPVRGEVGVTGDRISYIGAAAPGRAGTVIDAKGRAVAPGFINMLSWSNEALLYDGLGESSLRQGVTLEVMGEGVSMGPLSPAMAEQMQARPRSIPFEITWESLGEYLETLEERGIAINAASYVGAATVRMNVLGVRNETPSPAQIANMKTVVRASMEDGAMGVASSLIYPPGSYAGTEELIALAGEAGQCGGIYATHLRSEGDRFLESVDEALRIAEATGTPLEFFHLKVGGQRNFPKMAVALEKIDAAREAGLKVAADMYVYSASATTLAASIPPWVQQGSVEEMVRQLQDEEVRRRVIAEMRLEDAGWENVMGLAGGPENVVLAVVTHERLKPLLGMRISEIAEHWKVSPEEAILDILVTEAGRPEAVYFTMSDDNLREIIRKPYVSFASDGIAIAPRGVFLENGMHPRSYGNFARVFAQYVREEGIMPVSEAVRRMTGLPADMLSLSDRGLLEEGYFADIVIFDPKTIQDHSTYLDPHRHSTGVDVVIVNGVIALENGEPTGALPGRAVRGRAWLGHEDGGCRASAGDWTAGPSD